MFWYTVRVPEPFRQWIVHSVPWTGFRFELKWRVDHDVVIRRVAVLEIELVERPPRPFCLREPNLVGRVPGLRELPDVEYLPLGPELLRPRSGEGHVAFEFECLSLRQAGDP